MTAVLVATDAPWIAEEVNAALDDADTDVRWVRSGREVLPAVRAGEPDVVIVDLQIGNMGGIATAQALRLEESAGRMEPRHIILLLDRGADVFLAQRADVDGWLVKPLDALRIRRAVTAILRGDTWTEGSTAGTALG